MVQVLQPFEKGNGDTTSIQIQIWDDQTLVVDKNFVSSWSDWSICTFRNNLGLDSSCIVSSDNFFLGTCTENITWLFNKRPLALAIPWLRTFETSNGSMFKFVIFKSFDIDSIWIIKVAIPFRDANTFGSLNYCLQYCHGIL